MDKKKNKIFLNGKCEDALSLSEAFTNSAFLYGESIFTSALINKGALGFADAHFQRLKDSYEWLFCEELPFDDLTTYLKESLKESKLKNYFNVELVKLRVALFKDINSQTQVVTHLTPYIARSQSFKLETCISPELHLPTSVHTKIGSYARRFRAKRICHKEPLFYDIHGNILEASVANIIFVDYDFELVRPESDFQILEGITMSHGLDGMKIKKRTIRKKDVSQFKGAFLLNSLIGPMKVEAIDDVNYEHNEKLLDIESEILKTFEQNFKKSQSKLW